MASAHREDHEDAYTDRRHRRRQRVPARRRRGLGRASAIELARTHRAEVERGLRLKKAGNSLMELLGGRAVHPVNVRLGGFHRVPTPTELRPLAEQLKQALDDAWETVRWVAGFEFPDVHVEADLLALAAPDTYAIEGGTPTVLRADGTTAWRTPRCCPAIPSW
jgi:coenzyme F420-reducing hydrogenase alpha subunit